MLVRKSILVGSLVLAMRNDKQMNVRPYMMCQLKDRSPTGLWRTLTWLSQSGSQHRTDRYRMVANFGGANLVRLCCHQASLAHALAGKAMTGISIELTLQCGLR